MSNIEVYSASSGALGRPAAGAQAKASGYGGPNIMTWSSLDILPPADAQIASGISGQRTVRTASGFEQRATAWGADARRLVVFELVRPLQQVAGNKMRPAGPWTIASTSELTSTAPGRVRRGQVANDYAAEGAAPSSAATTTATQGPADHHLEDALDALAALPGVVQRGVTGAVRTPEGFMGSQYATTTPEGLIRREQIHLVRWDATTAVAVHAQRGSDQARPLLEVQAMPWDVHQVTLTPLSTSRAQLGGAKRLGIDGRRR